MKKKKNVSIKKWLDELRAGGSEIVFRWDGGNDSGSYYLEIDGEQSSDEIARRIENYVGESLDYGSFAGDFSTSGELHYKDGEFTGVDNYSTSESESVECNIEIKIPENLWFDIITVDTEGYLDDGLDVTFNFHISNGPVVKEHNELEEKLSEQIRQKLITVLNKMTNTYYISSVYNSWTFRFNDGIVKNGKRIFYINEVDFSYEETTEKDVCIEISDDLEQKLFEREKAERMRWEKIMEEMRKNQQ